jgi:hypothetical protein
MSLLAFSEEEHARLLAAEDRSGNAFVNAYNVAILLSNLVLWPTRTIDLFFRFYSQVKKYHSLSIVSSVRLLHRVQAKMDLRYSSNQPSMPATPWRILRRRPTSTSTGRRSVMPRRRRVRPIAGSSRTFPATPPSSRT